MGVNVTEKHLRAAHLYYEGATWIDACKVAGFRRILNISSDTCQAAIALHRKTVEPPDEAETLSPDIQPPLDPDLVALEELMGEDDPSWEEMAKYARKALVKIATGKLKAGAAQVASIKEIIARDEGKVGQVADVDTSESDIVKVVFLPVVDHAMGPIVHLGEVTDIDPGDQIPGLTIRQAVEK